MHFRILRGSADLCGQEGVDSTENMATRALYTTLIPEKDYFLDFQIFHFRFGSSSTLVFDSKYNISWRCGFTESVLIASQWDRKP